MSERRVSPKEVELAAYLATILQVALSGVADATQLENIVTKSREAVLRKMRNTYAEKLDASDLEEAVKNGMAIALNDLHVPPWLD